MFFKNATIFTLPEGLKSSPSELTEVLKTRAFAPVGAGEYSSTGWVPPKTDGDLVHAAGTLIGDSYMLICLQKESKLLPAKVIREETQRRISEIERKQERKLNKKERSALRAEVIGHLLPRALTSSTKTFAYIDVLRRLLIINTSSRHAAEEFTSTLRKTLGSLPAVLPTTRDSIASVLTRWVDGAEAIEGCTFDDECTLRGIVDSSEVRFKKQCLDVPEVREHLGNGKDITQLAITWNDRISFLFDEHFGIKRLRFLDLIQNKVADEAPEDQSAIFDAEFAIMAGELGALIDHMACAFDGWKPL